MKRVWMVVGLVGLLLSRVAGAVDYPKLANYTDTDGLGKPFLDDAGNVNQDAVWMLTRGHNLITLNATVHTDSRVGKLIPNIRACQHRAGSDSLKILAYDIVNYRWTPQFATLGTQWNRIHVALNTMEAAGKPSWIYNNGGSLQFFSVNWGNTQVMDSLITIWNYWANKPDSVNGFFLDEYGSDISWNNGTDGGINYARAGYAFLSSLDSTRRVQGPRFETALLAKAGSQNMLIVGNGTTPTSHQTKWNGRLYEGWLSSLWGTQQAFIGTYLANNKPYDMIRGDLSGTTIYGTTWCARSRYGLAIASMGDGWYCGDDARGIHATAVPYPYWILDETSVRPYPDCRSDTMGMHKGWLGQPKGAATQPTTGLWVRYFDHGAVVVNATGSTQSVTLNGAYKRIRGVWDTTRNNGSTGTTFSVNNSDGLFVVKVGRSRRWWSWWHI